jgi:uncharacterized protein
MMNYSDFNIFSKIKDSKNFFIVNLLSGNADILNEEEAGHLKSIREGRTDSNGKFFNELVEKGYFVNKNEENTLFRQKYLDFLDSRDKDEIQIFFVTNYSCNFSCNYCYQDQYINPSAELTTGIIDSFFSYINTHFKGRKKYITLFGGEPLLPGINHKNNIQYIINEANKYALDICIVTNGYTLSEYIDVLKTGRIREIQVTLDGTSEIHNKRRSLKGGGSTFDNIVKGIDLCLENLIPVNLRMVLDKENINNLPSLAQFGIEKGWTTNKLFKTQVGRNYELHHCQSSNEKLFSRISLYERIYDLIKENSHILQFYKPAYSVSKFLSENGVLPDPLFDSCPACKTEWAFDYTGNIYPCTATVGKKDESLGTFYPAININTDAAENWERRDVTSIEKCKTCNLKLACGGGCGSVARNKNGEICSPDCRPVTELLEFGFASYFSDQK